MCELSALDSGGFPNLVGEFVVDFVIGYIFIYIHYFGLG